MATLDTTLHNKFVFCVVNNRPAIMCGRTPSERRRSSRGSMVYRRDFCDDGHSDISLGNSSTFSQLYPTKSSAPYHKVYLSSPLSHKNINCTANVCNTLFQLCYYYCDDQTIDRTFYYHLDIKMTDVIWFNDRICLLYLQMK